MRGFDWCVYRHWIGRYFVGKGSVRVGVIEIEIANENVMVLVYVLCSHIRSNIPSLVPWK